MNPIQTQLQSFRSFVRTNASGGSWESVMTSDRQYAAHGLDRLERTSGDSLEDRLQNYRQSAERKTSVGFWGKCVGFGAGCLMTSMALVPGLAAGPVIALAGLAVMATSFIVAPLVQSAGEFDVRAATVLDQQLKDYRGQEGNAPRTLLAG